VVFLKLPVFSKIVRRPRVLQVVLSLNPGGTERLVVELARRLQDEAPAMVCCLDDAGAWAREVEPCGIEVVALERARGFRPMLGRAVAHLARRHEATVIHAHHYSPFVYSCLARLWRPGTRVIFTEHGRLSDTPPSAKRRLANRVLGRFPSRVFAVSEDLKRHLAGEGFATDALEVIYNGIEVGPVPDRKTRSDVRQALGVDDETFVVGTIARLDPVKDLGTLIEAAATVRAELPIVVAIVGDGPERPSLEAAARRFGVGAQIRFLGHREDARRWLAGCDAYVNCSISEGVSLTILEAMAAALPIIATRVGGTPEVVDADSGRLIPARHPAALSQALVQLARSPQIRATLGRSARQRLETRFTLERMVREYAEVYASVTEGRAGGRH
jgi:glycosyltransferase involved in cell wall biosynthesis